MSDPCIEMENRRRYLNYTTPVGVSLGQISRTGWSAFLIHECGFRDRLENWNHPGVDSPFWRFYHNLTPGCHIHHQGMDLPLEPESCVLIPANAIFDCCGPCPAAHCWIHFTVSRLAGPVPGVPVRLDLDPPLRGLIKAVLQEHGHPASAQRDRRLHHYSSALLHAAFARLELAEVEVPNRLLDVLDLIEKAPHTDLSNPLLAEHAGMGVERFIRTFREHTGETPAAYVISARLRLAGEALALTDKSIDEIAAAHGFPNRHYFSRMFARRFGCGPAEFRARQTRKRGR